MEFVRSRKAQSVPSSASPSKHPQGERSKESFPLENVSRESEPSGAAMLFEKPQEIEMEEGDEEEQEEELPAPPAVKGMMGSK